jgi:hypothetical protein
MPSAAVERQIAGGLSPTPLRGRYRSSATLMGDQTGDCASDGFLSNLFLYDFLSDAADAPSATPSLAPVSG